MLAGDLLSEPGVDASESVAEPDLSWPPEPVASVELAEVPEVETFFWARRMALAKAVAVVAALLATGIGVRAALAEGDVAHITAEDAARPARR